jgi:hypothetical protein
MGLRQREVRARFEVDPPRTWYYYIFSNSYTLVILLQIDLIFGDEPETVYESCYEIEDTSIFAWSLIYGVRHYRWLCGPIRQLPLNNKVDYLIHIVQRILDFLEL